MPNDGALPWSYGPYSYDPAGNITTISSQYFVYDPMGRLVKSSANDREKVTPNDREILTPSVGLLS